ncbi:MAG: hypothetical protein IJF73_01470 [Clostridia bacterium]|nr:hypothetical protein [Clostridia bacterium]
MKKITKLTAVCLVAVLLLLSLVGCNKRDSLVEAYTEAGYDVTVTLASNDKVKAFFTLLGYTAEQIDDMDDQSFIAVYRGVVPYALIACYSSSFELKDDLIEEEDGVKDTSAYDKAKANGKINGNCLLLYSIGDTDVIFAAN